MNIRLLFLLSLPLVSGCFSIARTTVSQWGIDYEPDAAAVRSGEGAAKYGSVRLTQVTVRAPYDSRNLVVLRANGSIAFDPCNEFAAVPSALVKGMALDALQKSGVFGFAVGSTSAARVEHSLEFNVRQLALDCRGEGGPVAVAEISSLLLRKGEFVARGHAEGRVPVVDGDFHAAFSQAVSAAVLGALKAL